MNVIEVEDVSKMFRLGAHTGDLRERFNHWTGRQKARETQAQEKEFWALRDISFTVAQGESFGIIGHNGSGKSTLLKLITGIYKPTRGAFRTQGRIAALIEVGAGFHPDLTGRENVYLNGSVLGMKKREIEERFDDIVAFSELERFIDTPVKRYSSGMYMRLGFAVAAHIDPEVVLVDEVLAVGDESFQNKCMKKMLELRSEGRTIIFISHQMGAITTLCQRVMLLDQGRIETIGKPEEVIDAYRNGLSVRSRQRELAARAAHNGLTLAEQEAQDRAAREEAEAAAREQAAREAAMRAAAEEVEAAAKPIRVLKVRVLDRQGEPAHTAAMNASLSVECAYHANSRMEGITFGVALLRDRGPGQEPTLICGTNSRHDKVPTGPVEGEGQFRVAFDLQNLLPGQYHFAVSLGTQADPTNPIDYRSRAAELTITGDVPQRGLVLLPHVWHMGARGRAAAAPEQERPEKEMPGGHNHNSPAALSVLSSAVG